MSWLTNYVRPKIQQLVAPREVPDNLWTQCPACGQMIYQPELDRHGKVCTHCGHHMRLPAAQRLTMLLDEGSVEKLPLPKVPVDPLRFRDSKRYSDRLREAQAKTGETDALLVARGAIGGAPAVVAILDFTFMGGSMGMGVGEGLVMAAERAVADQAAFIVVTASGGARMQEGILSLMQMARTTIAVSRVKEAGLPYIVVLTDPTTGGVTASFAMQGDFTLAEPGSLVGFAGRRVIEQTIREKLPEGFQSAEYLLEHGMVDMVVKRQELKPTLARLLDMLRDPAPEPMDEPQSGEAAPVPAKP